jgi:hypothetical protein
MTINFNDMPAKQGAAPLPENWYTVKCVKTDITISSSGNRMIKAEFNVIDPPKYGKRKLWNHFVLNPSSLWVLKNYLEYTGLDNLGNGSQDEEEIAQAMVGTVAKAYAVPNGKNNNIEGWQAAEGNTEPPAENPTSNALFK